jgi:hypothetical protein
MCVKLVFANQDDVEHIPAFRLGRPDSLGDTGNCKEQGKEDQRIEKLRARQAILQK